MNNKKPLVYLARPYTHEDPAVMEDRFKRVTRKASQLIKKGMNVFSPITMFHPMTNSGLPVEPEHWIPILKQYMSVSNKMIVLMLPGWDKSTGVKEEAQWAINEFYIHIEYIEEKEACDSPICRLHHTHPCEDCGTKWD